jgi:ATP-dependent Clp protease, protease subunit
MLPNIIITIGRNTKIIDIPTKLLQDRIIYLNEEINSETANHIIMQLLWLKADKPKEDIDFYINSNGGCVYNTFAIIDVINNIECKVNTTGMGMCASGASMLLSAGTGTRGATKNCRIMLHSIQSQIQGAYNDIKIHFDETEFQQNQIINFYAEVTKKSKTEIRNLIKRDSFLSAQESLEMGIIDEII